MQMEGIVDSIKAPFVELGELAKGIGKTFLNFGKAFKTPIKSLKLFGAGLLTTMLSFLTYHCNCTCRCCCIDGNNV